MGTSPIGISGKWTPPGFTTPRLCPPSSSGFIPPSSLKSVPSAPFVPAPSPRHPGTLFPTVGALSPLRARFFPPWGRFFRSVRAFSVPCVLFPQWGRFFRSVRAFSRRGGAFSAPCALFPTVGALFPFRALFQSSRKSSTPSSPHHKSPIPCLPSLFIPFLHSYLPHSQFFIPIHPPLPIPPLPSRLRLST
jgi:hypothetical protein